MLLLHYMGPEVYTTVDMLGTITLAMAHMVRPGGPKEVPAAATELEHFSSFGRS